MTWYEEVEQYEHDRWIGPGAPSDREIGGPKGVALVDDYSDGRTTPGWGPTATDKHDGFVVEYTRGRFDARPRVRRDAEKQAPFAFVMRSMLLIAVDVDRHLGDKGADGFVGMRTTGFEWPATMAETSKSGDGRHLFYQVPDLWHPQHGYGAYEDAIGLWPGVDVRAVGCVYHYPTQRWNNLPVAQAPAELITALELHSLRKTSRASAIAKAVTDQDETEILIMHDNLKAQLAANIPAGKRNVTLYAIAKDMHDSGFPNWEDAITQRGDEIGLEPREVERLIQNAAR